MLVFLPYAQKDQCPDQNPEYEANGVPSRPFGMRSVRVCSSVDAVDVVLDRNETQKGGDQKGDD